MSKQVKCLVRKSWVSATPEEMIRQNLLIAMTQQLGYPLDNIVVEKNLRLMPHLQLMSKAEIPDRRFDIVVLAKGIHPKEQIYPLLLIECKAVPLAQKVINQVVGYNLYLKSYFVAVANDREVKLGWYDATKKTYCFRQGLASYSALKQKLV